MRWELMDVVSDDVARAVLAAARRRRFARGEVVFHEGDAGHTLHLVDKGHVAVRVTTPSGDSATLRIIGPGGFFGELAVISEAPRNATVLALDAVETLALHRDVVNALRKEHPAVDLVLLEALVHEVRRLSTALVDALYVPVQKRVARRLLEAAASWRGADEQVSIPLTQEHLAGLCGATRPWVNRMLTQLQDSGVVTLRRGRITVIDQAALERLAR